jgi:hypothetical protein
MFFIGTDRHDDENHRNSAPSVFSFEQTFALNFVLEATQNTARIRGTFKIPRKKEKWLNFFSVDCESVALALKSMRKMLFLRLSILF